jgi:hypothetical protein
VKIENIDFRFFFHRHKTISLFLLNLMIPREILLEKIVHTIKKYYSHPLLNWNLIPSVFAISSNFFFLFVKLIKSFSAENGSFYFHSLSITSSLNMKLQFHNRFMIGILLYVNLILKRINMEIYWILIEMTN